MKQLKALIALILMAVSVAASSNAAIIDETIDNVKYRIYEGYGQCMVTGLEPGTTEATIPAMISYANKDYKIVSISITNSEIIKLIILGAAEGVRDLDYNKIVIENCANLEYFSLPSDIKKVETTIFRTTRKIKDLVLPMDRILEINVLSTDANLSLSETTLHVPTNMVDKYKDKMNFELENSLKFWQSCKEIVAIQDEPDPEPEPEPEPAKPEGVKLTTPAVHFMLADAMPEHTIHLDIQDGNKFSYVTWQGDDVTDEILNNKVLFKVPEYTGVGELNVVTEEDSGISEIESVEADASLRVSVAGGMVKIAGAQFGQAATVTDLSGRVIYCGESREIALLEGVYLLSIAGRTFKFRI